MLESSFVAVVRYWQDAELGEKVLGLSDELSRLYNGTRLLVSWHGIPRRQTGSISLKDAVTCGFTGKFTPVCMSPMVSFSAKTLLPVDNVYDTAVHRLRRPFHVKSCFLWFIQWYFARALAAYQLHQKCVVAIAHAITAFPIRQVFALQESRHETIIIELHNGSSDGVARSGIHYVVPF